MGPRPTVLLLGLCTALLGGAAWYTSSPTRTSAGAVDAPEAARAPDASGEPRAPAELAAPAQPLAGPAAPDAAEPELDVALPERETRAAAARPAPVPGISLHGIVHAFAGLDASDASVTLRGPDGGARMLPVYAGGAFEFADLRPGAWTLVAEARGHRPAQLEVALAPGESEREVGLQLEPLEALLVHLDLADAEHLAERLEGEQPFASWGLPRVVATAEMPDPVLRPEAFGAAREAGMPPFVRRPSAHAPAARLLDASGPEQEPQAEPALPASCVGVFALARPTAMFVNLCLGPVVLQSRAVQAGEREVRFQLSSWDLDRFLVSARIQLVDSASGARLSNVEGVLRHPVGGSVTARSDASGVLAFRALVPGWYGLSVQAEGLVAREERVYVEPTGETDLGIWELDVRATLRGRVVDAAGRPVAVALLAKPLAAIDAQRFVRAASGRSGEDGTFALESLGRGRHVLLVEDERFAARPAFVDTTGGDVFDVRIEVEPATAVSIEMADDLPQGALVRLETPEGLPVFAALPRYVRSYDVRLAPGRYELAVVNQGRLVRRRSIEVGREPLELVAGP